VTNGFVVLDTDVASLSFKRRLPPALLAQLVGTDVCITFVTLGELTKWAELRRWGKRNRDALQRWLDRALLLPYDRRVATVWGELQADGVRRGRPRPANDSRRGTRRPGPRQGTRRLLSLVPRWSRMGRHGHNASHIRKTQQDTVGDCCVSRRPGGVKARLRLAAAFTERGSSWPPRADGAPPCTDHRLSVSDEDSRAEVPHA